jgi:membrane protein YdbS with pleckstrin-like domain
MGLLCVLETGMGRTSRYWSIHEENLSMAGFSVMLLFAVVMLWLVPWLRKRGFRTWAKVAEAVSLTGIVVCVFFAFF